MLQTSVPTLIKTVQEDTDRQVVIVTLETFKEMLDKIKTPVLEGVNRVDQIMTMIRNVLQQKVWKYTNLCRGCYSRWKSVQYKPVARDRLKVSRWPF